jgi:hypothetical protein
VHPIGSLWPLPVYDVVADGIAILEYPQFGCSSSFRDYSFRVPSWSRLIHTSHDGQEWATYFLHHFRQVKGFQFLQGLLLTGGTGADDQ